MSSLVMKWHNLFIRGTHTSALRPLALGHGLFESTEGVPQFHSIRLPQLKHPIDSRLDHSLHSAGQGINPNLAAPHGAGSL
jgi:hypothetical protein